MATAEGALGETEPRGRGPAVMAGLGCAAAFAALSVALPIENLLPRAMGDLAETWLAPAMAVLGFIVGYALGRSVGVRRATPEVEASEVLAETEPDAVSEAELEAPVSPLVAEPLDRLGPVQLVERLAMAVERNAPPQRNTARAAQLAAQLSALAAMPRADAPGVDDSVHELDDEEDIDIEEERSVDERRYSSLLDMGLPRANRSETSE